MAFPCKNAVLAVAAWMWVLTVMALYLRQFASLANLVRRAVGL